MIIGKLCYSKEQKEKVSEEIFFIIAASSHATIVTICNMNICIGNFLNIGASDHNFDTIGKHIMKTLQPSDTRPDTIDAIRFAICASVFDDVKILSPLRRNKINQTIPSSHIAWHKTIVPHQ